MVDRTRRPNTNLTTTQPDCMLLLHKTIDAVWSREYDIFYYINNTVLPINVKWGLQLKHFVQFSTHY